MKRNLSRVVAVLAPAIIACASPTWAQYVQYVNNQTPRAVATSYYDGAEDAAPQSVAENKDAANQSAPAAGSCGCNSGGSGGCATCGSCDSCSSCDNGCCDLWAGCENCPDHTLILFTGFDSWRGFSDGSWVNNNGVNTGFNWGTNIGDSNVGFQFGSSFGVYDWNGRGFPGAENDEAQTQVFITTGFFKKADGCSNWSAGIVYDWSINNNFGVFSNEPTLGQWRGTLSYAVNACNEFGFWGTLRDRSAIQQTPIAPTGVVSFRSVNQANFFWHHKFEQGADSYIWFGFPDDSKLGPLEGSLGDFIVGGSVSAPISETLALYGNVAYMSPSAAPGVAASAEDTWNVGFGLAFYPYRNARTHTVSGSCSAPLQNVANNGTFFVDASQQD